MVSRPAEWRSCLIESANLVWGGILVFSNHGCLDWSLRIFVHGGRMACGGDVRTSAGGVVVGGMMLSVAWCVHENEQSALPYHQMIIVDTGWVISRTCDCYTWWESVVACTSDRAERGMSMIRRISSADTDVVVNALVWLISLTVSVYIVRLWFWQYILACRQQCFKNVVMLNELPVLTGCVVNLSVAGKWKVTTRTVGNAYDAT